MKFKTNDIIIKAGFVYPQGALVVDGYDEQGRLLVYPLGGGLQYVFRTEEPFRLVSEQERQGLIWKQGRVYIEGLEGKFKGWTKGLRWNGWERPYFEWTEAQKLAEALGPEQIHYDATRDAFITPNAHDGEEAWAGCDIEVAQGQKLRVYGIGAGSWTWQEAAS